MPYHCNVLGPDKVNEKHSIWQKSMMNKKQINEKEIKDHKEDGYNPYFKHLSSAPYLLVFTQRVCKPNAYYQRSIDEGDYFEQTDSKKVESMIRTTATEVGMFMANLSAFALEKGLDTSTIACFPYSNLKAWSDLPWVKYPVVLLGSIGKAKLYRRNRMGQEERKMDMKPEPEEVIKWI